MTASADPHTASPKSARHLAFGVDPSRPERYSLRQARYAALADDISRWAGEAARRGQMLSVLDVGCGWGPLLRHLEAKPHFDNVVMSAADIKQAFGFRKEAYRDCFIGDLTQGYPEIPSSHYDVVVCEQVLEHLAALDSALATLVRLVRPGGRLAIGVPIFLPPLHLARKHLVPRLPRLLRPDDSTHQQAFSLASFLRELRKQPALTVEAVRGFRIISGGLLRPLENYRWWWRFNRRLGELLPAACIEAQIIARKQNV
ncbi:MAG: class I SAM-dependent methyltransferase [Alphaproteobacteria bacterium]|nr:class I SAM-dependent methyltransferase [Alphaproteobacteria bacterium]